MLSQWKLLPLGLILSTMILTGCGEKIEGRPTAEQVAKGFKSEVLADYPEAAKDLSLDLVALCYGEMAVESDLPDEAVQKLAHLNDDYEFTIGDQNIMKTLSPEVESCTGEKTNDTETKKG